MGPHVCFSVSYRTSCLFLSVIKVLMSVLQCHKGPHVCLSVSQRTSCLFYSVIKVLMSVSQCHKGPHVCFTVSKGISCFIVSKGMFSLFHNVKKESPVFRYWQPLWHHVSAIRLWKFVHFQILWFIIKRNTICEYLLTDIRSWIWLLFVVVVERVCV